jgi:VIT1/CCC1 family predicted Fe2+/Mn2+ transporter
MMQKKYSNIPVLPFAFGRGLIVVLISPVLCILRLFIVKTTPTAKQGESKVREGRKNESSLLH